MRAFALSEPSALRVWAKVTLSRPLIAVRAKVPAVFSVTFGPKVRELPRKRPDRVMSSVVAGSLAAGWPTPVDRL